MAEHITGQSWEFFIGALNLTTESASLSISDSTKAKNNRGRPNGFVRGLTAGEGEFELDAEQVTLLTAFAATKGSWQELTDIDIRGIAVVDGNAQTIEAFGCVLMITDVMNAASNGEEAATSKIKYFVAGKDFVNINGVPYLKSRAI